MEMQWDKNVDVIKESILNEYPRNKGVITKVFGEKSGETGKKIVQILKNEGLTYEQAYASLQYAYETLQYESNFVKVR